MELEVVVSKGRGLLAMDTSMFSKSSSDPYVVVVVEGKEIGRTEVITKSLNPCWSERTSFRAFVADTGPVSVELRLFDEDKLSRDARARVRRSVVETRRTPPREPQDPMGEHKFDGRAAFAATGGAARWVAVAPCAGCAKAKGELEVAVALAGGAAPGGSALARVAGAVGAANDELVASEAAYVSDLKVLRDAFEGPLRLEMGTKQRRVERVGVLEVLDRVFEALDAVLALAETRVLPAFEAAKNSGAWADCFEALAPELCDAYGAYVVAYASVWETWSAARASDGDLGALVDGCEADVSRNPRRLTMQALAIMPVQRIARYELLLSALRKAVEKHRRPLGFRDDAAGLGRAAGLARLAATDVNVAAATTTASHSLRLKVLRGAGLVDKDRSALSFVKGKSDPYCVVLVDGREVGRTSTQKQTLDPDWTGTGVSGDDDDDACFDLLVAEASRVCVQIFDWDQWSADDPMGEVNVKISDLLEDWGRFFAARDAHGAAVMRGDYDDPSVERSLWITVEPTDGCRVCGRLQLALALATFDKRVGGTQTFAKPRDAKRALTHALYLWLPRADDVAARGAAFESKANFPDAYVVISVAGGEEGRTNVDHRATQPRWRKINAMHAVPVGPTDVVDLEVRDWSRRGDSSGGGLGRATLSVAALLAGDPLPDADLSGGAAHKGRRGTLLLRSPSGAPCGRLHARLRLVALNAADRPARVTELTFAGARSEAPPTAAATLTIAAARGLVASDIHLTSKPSSDPYVVVLRDGVEVHRTKTVKKNLNPTYDDTFEVDLSPRTSRLRFLVFDYDRLTADDAMGEVNIDVADVEDAAPKWYDLEATGGCKATGSLRVAVDVPRRDPLSAAAALASRKTPLSAAEADQVRGLMQSRAAAAPAADPLAAVLAAAGLEGAAPALAAEKVGLDDLYGALDAGDLASLLGELDLKAGDRARLKRALEASRAA